MPTAARAAHKIVYERRRPERSSLYEVVRDNLAVTVVQRTSSDITGGTAQGSHHSA